MRLGSCQADTERSLGSLGPMGETQGRRLILDLHKPEWGLHHTPTVRDHEEMWILLELEVVGVVAEANA